MATQKQNDLMNRLIRQAAPETAKTPEDTAAKEQNSWFRDSVREAQAERFESLWVRMMSAHLNEQLWNDPEAWTGDNDNG